MSSVSADGTKCATCIYTNPTTTQIEVWPVDKYTFEPLTFRVYQQKAPTKTPYVGFNIPLALLDKNDDVTSTFFLQTDENGEAIFVPQYSGKYRVEVDNNYVYFTVKSRNEEAIDNQLPQTNETNLTNESTETNNTVPVTLPPINLTGEQILGEGKLPIFLFGAADCPHCAAEKTFLKKLEAKYPQIEVLFYEVKYNASNRPFFEEMAERHNVSISTLPVTFIGDDYVVAYFSDNVTGAEIENLVRKHLGLEVSGNASQYLEIPIFGRIDPKTISIPVLTVGIGLLDGFNPCSMWVLTFLLGLLIYTGSRKRVLLVGGIFIFASAFIYFLFMALWLNLFLIIGYVDILRIIIGLVAIIAGFINLKDFFFFKKGFSLVIPEKAKPGLFARMRSVVKENRMTALIAGTVFLAVTVNIIELLCTAGFPAIYTRVLTLQNLPVLSYYFYIALYCFFYIIPLAVIVIAFAKAMEAKKFTESHGKILKLVGGLLMLLLGLALIFFPRILSFG